LSQDNKENTTPENESKKANTLGRVQEKETEGGKASGPSDGGKPSEPSDPPQLERKGSPDEVKEAKAKAAAAARARAQARGKKAESAEEAPKPPSPKQPLLDELTAIFRQEVAEDAVEEAVINEINDHLPTVTVKNEHWYRCAETLANHPSLQMDYLENLSGVDRETHMEVVYHLYSFQTNRHYCLKVKTDREKPSIASVTPIWPSANWNEREVYDLLGIDFPGHPDLRRIMMPDDWVGHPLRKDYEPIDPEV
jgi:NADH-quinone oxidoreductase subunit C